MAISEKLLKFKFHISIATLFIILLVSLVLVAPRFLDILAYFWPLLLSTALFLVVVVVFGQISPSESDVISDKAGADLIDFVAGQPEEADEQKLQ